MYLQFPVAGGNTYKAIWWCSVTYVYACSNSDEGGPIVVKLGLIHQMWEQSCPTGTAIPTWFYNECKYFYNKKEKKSVFTKPFVSILIAFSHSTNDITYTNCHWNLKRKVNWGLQWIQAFIQGSLEHFEVKNSCGLSFIFLNMVTLCNGWMEVGRLQNSIPAM